MTTTGERQQASGRPRSAEVTQRVLTAARAVFGARGVAAVTMSEIAAEAGVGLDSIYRRWPSKQALLVELVATAVETGVRVPDTGSLAKDLELLVLDLSRAVDGDLGELLASAVAESARDAALAARFAAAQAARRDLTKVVVARAQVRGELPNEIDASLLLDLLAGLVWQRAWLRRVPLTPSDVRAAVRHVLAGFTTGSAA